MSEGSLTEVDSEIVNRVIDQAKADKIGEFSESGAPGKAFISYLDQLVRYATGEDALWDNPESLLKRAGYGWAHAERRSQNENKIHLRIEQGDTPLSRRLMLDIVTDDKPFLVDSVSAALADAGKPVSFFSNAVIDVVRDEKGLRTAAGNGRPKRESMIHAEMDPPVAEAEIEILGQTLEKVLDDVAIAVSDWEPMRARLSASIAQLERSRLPGVKSDAQRETIEFLKWLWNNRFALLGYRRFNADVDANNVAFTHDPDSDLGISRDQDLKILRVDSDTDGPLTPSVEDFLRSSEPLIITKANSRSLVHRRAHLDYIGVKTYDIDGTVTGEDRYVGLFTADAYNRPATDIPLIRAKLNSVLDQADFNPGGHNEKALINILETYPRDELFQIDAEALHATSLGILRLYKRPRAKIFLRRDRFDRFISALVFIPRDRFNSIIREEIGEFLATTFHGRVSSFSPSFGDAALVRVHFIIGIQSGAPQGPGNRALTAEIRRICRDWSDDLLESLRRAHDGVTPTSLYEKYVNAFEEGYKERSEIADTLRDITALENLKEQKTSIRAYRKAGDNEDVVRIKIYRCDGPYALSALIPTIENLGLRVIQEAGYQVKPQSDDGSVMWIHDFYTEQNQSQVIDLEDVKKSFEDTILAVLDGRAEDDRFNGLVLTAGVDWREAWLLRAASKFNVQTNFAYSQSYMEDALCNHPSIARMLISGFHTRFNPAGSNDLAAREKEAEAAFADIFSAINDIESLAEDRILRRYVNLFGAILRTNFYQRATNGDAKPTISFKFDSQRIDDLPEPRPYREIFVCGPSVDGVHMRFGPIARGGLRWSDRKEDYRTEILGLVKAQRVKNAVIVPNGSKGGFYPKRLPTTSDRSVIYEHGREAYKLFIRGLLDLTDNIVRGQIEAPANTVLWDAPDPYLVVAADKGTAQFSDTSNAIALEYGFWLGDAFASGGSVGYDHKAMGITARGAWEAVKRHFREVGKDIQNEPFTAIGVGDMSGDVFGNGMLLSEQTKLIAAFDHRDIFIDPNPDPQTSFQERKRLFELPRSSWNDYDASLISNGGGVFPRSAKSIPISKEIRAMLGVTQNALAPNDLIKAILKAPVELFWMGGIGTYYKAETEDDRHVGDRANDSIRVNAKDAGAQIVGEGANLGFTQRARIEFARNGGRINTDAIDNSAGVDSSDHEVNIKILLAAAIEQAELKETERNDLLASMTDEVARLVLKHNYEQTRAVTLMEDANIADIDLHGRFMSTLEKAGRLDRDIEYLPNAEEIAALRQQSRGLTRPELSVLTAYAKLWVFDVLVESSVPDDPIFERELYAYFPKALHGYTKPLTAHRLRREIIATRLANDIVDVCGISFLQRIIETFGEDFPSMTLAFECARQIFELDPLMSSINDLDNASPALVQTSLHREAANLINEQAVRLLCDPRFLVHVEKFGIKSTINKYSAPVLEYRSAVIDILGPEERTAMQARVDGWSALGAPDAIAKSAAVLPTLAHAIDIVDLASEAAWSNPGVSALFFNVGRQFYFNLMREKAHTESLTDNYDRISMQQLVRDLSSLQCAVTKTIIDLIAQEPAGAPADWMDEVMDRWQQTHNERITKFFNATAELDLTGTLSVGKLSLYIKKLEAFIDAL